MSFETISIFVGGFGCGGIVVFLYAIRSVKKSIEIVEKQRERIATLEEHIKSLEGDRGS